MAIRSGVPINRVDLTSGADSTIASSAATETKEVYQLNAHDTAGSAGGNIELFLSDDATSASGERVERVTLAANETASFAPVSCGKSRFLIAKADFAGCTINGIYTLRNGSDV